MAAAAPFVFVSCHQGAEPPLKSEFSVQGWRLAFSRPGFVSFKHEPVDAQNSPTRTPVELALPTGTFARSVSWSIGRTETDDTSQLAAEVARLVGEATRAELIPASPETFDALHLWARDRLPVGERSYEPGPEPLTEAIAVDVAGRLHTAGVIQHGIPNEPVQTGLRVLDICMTDPGKWMVGWHQPTSAPPTQWPGGFPPINMAHDVVSRAYFKAAEAALWSKLPMRPGDTVVEIGSAPGGAAQRMLELGMHVIGVDPAEMDPRVGEHPNYKHIQARGGDIKREEYSDAKWLLVDSNVRPDKTLVTVGNIVNHRRVRIQGMLLTMKMGRYDQADRISGWCRELRQWGFPNLSVRQLATGRCEVCIAARRDWQAGNERQVVARGD